MSTVANASGWQSMAVCGDFVKESCTPPPPRISYAKVPNQYGPYAYCSLDKALDARVQKEKFAW